MVEHPEAFSGHHLAAQFLEEWPIIMMVKVNKGDYKESDKQAG